MDIGTRVRVKKERTVRGLISGGKEGVIVEYPPNVEEMREHFPIGVLLNRDGKHVTVWAENELEVIP